MHTVLGFATVLIAFMLWSKPNRLADQLGFFIA